ncbi:hypothetical protein ACIBSV_46745 [Embleya sp. NPDC050154]|uniref:hypothetical protein n=1 Tax=Embleya sp. NPDC050154 TaxID=3363988 RepID=UPI0037BA3DBB
MEFRALADWLLLGVEADYQPGTEVPDAVPPYVMLTETPGPGLAVEDSMDHTVWQLRCAGEAGQFEEESYANSQALAMSLDRRIVTAPWPLVIGTVRVTDAQRLGSRPRFLLRSDDETAHFVATYLFMHGY